MKRFRYYARTREGDPREGTLAAVSLKEAADILRDQELFVVKLKAAKEHRGYKRLLHSHGNVKYAALFCRQLSVMLDEQPLNGILSMLAKQKGDSFYQSMMQGMCQEIELGKSLSEAMEKYDHVFPSNVIHIVKAGQESGNLTMVLVRLADFLEKQEAARLKLQSAMLYPALIGTAVMVAIGFLIIFILPTFVVLFENFRSELPMPTRFMLELGRLAEIYGMWIPICLALVTAIAGWLYLQEPIRYRVDYWILKIPFWGRLQQETAWMQILSTLAVEMEGGMRIDAALEQVCNVPSNRYIRSFLGQLQESVSHGFPMVHLLENCPVFPVMLSELIAAGESTGRLEEMLQKASEYCALSADTRSQRLQAMMEPALLLLLAGVVLGFVLSIVLPLMEMMDQVI